MSGPPTPLAVDAFVNVGMGSMEKPDWLVRVAEDYFKRADAIFQDVSVSELVDLMDREGVAKAILSTRAEEPDPKVLAFSNAHPDRFALSLSVDPRRGMPALRALQSLVRSEPVALARAFPFMTGLAPNDRVYYPLYAKCVDLGLPISINTGIPGPPAPGAVQHPIHLDDVCLYFPELVLVMAHGADPWWDVAIRLMLKYRNLYLMTSAYAPRYFPESLLHYMNTRGKQKILFASDHPVLSMERCVREARALDLREGVLEDFLAGNAQRVLLAPMEGRRG
ncbi:MAG: amidohydrolase [Deltaproteobacteria bacterium]|nr:amidohydrolase [Deltaproteobacteria bacterium]MCB9785091.1 amidohydrolase [Deltaproteobacteria bacterium]